MQEINTEIYLKNKKNKKREYGRNRYHMSEEKQKLKEYQKSYCEANKSRKSAESRNLITKMNYYIHNKLQILIIFFLSLYALS